MKFFYKRAIQLLDTMFTIEDDHIRASFLHPNYKQLRGATKMQIRSCHAYYENSVLPAAMDDDPVRIEEDTCEPPAKKLKLMSQLVDKKKTSTESIGEVDRYISIIIKEEYTDPLVFWRQQRIQLAFPTLYRLAKRVFAVPCSSASVERQFSTAGQIVTHRR
jgi:hypothetical protein